MRRFGTSRRLLAAGAGWALSLALSGCSDEPETPVVDAGVDAPVPECVVASDCPGQDSDCQTKTCTDGACGVAMAALDTPVAAQVPGDCRLEVCDGNGAIVSKIDDTDLPPIEGACSTPTCEGGLPIYAHKKDGLPCVDADPCTVLDHCQFGVCIGSGPLECTGGSSCWAGVCTAPQCSGVFWFGGPPLSPLSPEPSDAEPFALSSGDLDGDGLVDLAVVNTTHVDVLRGNGNGTFSPIATLSEVPSPTAVATADVNGDGKLDLAVANSTKLWVFLNPGNGTFSGGTSYTTGGGTKQISVADLDGDSKPDLATLHEGGVSIFLNQGGGTLAPEIPVLIGPYTGGLFIADVNGDGLPDLVSSYHLDFDNRIKVMSNQGNGSFVEAGNYPFYGLGPAPFVSSIDIDGDGSLDIFGTSLDGTQALLNEGNGTFVHGLQSYPFRGRRVLVTETNGVSGPDLLFYRGVAATTFVTGDGASFVSAELDGVGEWDAIAADVNDDGWKDIVVGNPIVDQVEVLLNDGLGWFFRPVAYAGGPATYPGAAPGALVARDLNADGKPDVAITNVDRGDVTVLLSDSEGKLDAQTNYSYPVGESPRAIAAEDLNGDGRIDLVVVNELSEDLSVLLNQGDGKFYLSPAYALGVSPKNLVITDVNDDERPDLFVAGGTHLWTLLNQGDGTFGAPVETVGLLFASSLSTADLNGDGRPDFAVGNDLDHALWVLASKPDGGLLEPVKYELSGPVEEIEAADVDGDDRPDLIVGGSGVSVLSNLGDGTFAAPVDHPLPFWVESIAISDFDMDGKKDVAAMAQSYRQVMILSNVGGGALQPTGSFFAGHTARSVMAADMNADGRPDLITAGTDPTENARVNILLNACQP